MATIFGSSYNDNNTTNGVPFIFRPVLKGTLNNDFLYGYAGNDILYGYKGNDVLSGGTGIDTLYGGEGSDTYFVDSASDKVFESASTSTYNGGIDTVKASVSYTLSANVENLVLLGSSNINGIGNASNNGLSGNSANNRLFGLDGNDYLYGYGGADSLYGGNGNDYMDGGTGSDSMVGGSYDDTYIVDNIGDSVVELASTATYYAGNDTVRSSISYTLTNNVETLVLTGSSALNGTGNSLKNSIWGNTASNILNGGDGNDYINAGDGNDNIFGSSGNDTLIGTSDYGVGEIDTMTGGAGNDTFVLGISVGGEFPSKSRLYDDGALGAGTGDYALIQDFNVNEDKIQLVGSSSDYVLSASPVLVGTAVADTGIYLKKAIGSNELVGVIRDIAPANLSISGSYFSYV